MINEDVGSLVSRMVDKECVDYVSVHYDGEHVNIDIHKKEIYNTPDPSTSMHTYEKLEEIAKDVMMGKWGPTMEAVERTLSHAGYNPETISKIIDSILKRGFE